MGAREPGGRRRGERRIRKESKAKIERSDWKSRCHKQEEEVTRRDDERGTERKKKRKREMRRITQRRVRV